ncbi:MAG: hypothetical protein QM755_24785 [Luteolibacter sp.]
MKTAYASLLLTLALAVPVSAQTKNKATESTPPAAAVPDPGWPRELSREGAKLIYNQPQIEAWDNYRQLKAKVAFALTPQGGKSVVGVAELEGGTIANLEARTVFIEELKLSAVRFPALDPADAASMEMVLRRVFPGKSLTLSLDRILSGLDEQEASEKPVDVKMDPPPIFVSERPAALLIVDGKPVHAPLGDTGLEFVVNTSWDVFFDPAGKRYFLLNDKIWLSSTDIRGGWALATNVPAALSKVPEDWDYVKKTLPVKVTKGTRVPDILSSDKPAELIAFDGAPVFQKVSGTTGLMWAVNTESWVFQNKEDSQYYYLVSGRWFRTASLSAGPWTYAGNDLPEDFKRIPRGHPCDDVLSSVPGTVEARDAVMLAQVPVEASVNVAEAESKAVAAYDGAPEFTTIEGTGMSYAKNSGSSVIQVQGSYYLCQDAVWFISSAPSGPWKICTNVPGVIYTIPASSPVHNVTYVKVQAAPPAATTVTCSYTAGYYGAFIAGVMLKSVLVYGSGWYYPPYIYYGYPGRPIYRPVCYPSYGVAAAYNPWTGGYAIGQRWYGPYASAGRAAWYNPATGRYGRVSTVQTPYGGRTAAAGYNPRTDTAWVTRQGSNGYAQWGNSVVTRGNDYLRVGHVITDEGGAVRWKGSDGGGKVKWSDDGASGVAYRDGNLYVGKDGNLYHRDKSGDWDRYGDGGSWGQANVPNHPEAGGRPSTLPAPPERKPDRTPSQPAPRPTQPDRKPVQPTPRPTPYTPPADVSDSLNRDAISRRRGEDQVIRRQEVSPRGAPSPSTTSRSFNRTLPTKDSGVRRRP